MDKKYLVKLLTLNTHRELVIDESKFLKLKIAKEHLTDIFSFEEKYELLISNYTELEKEYVNIATEHIINGIEGYENFFRIELRFNQRIVNLLTTTRLYMDQIKQHIKNYNLELDIEKLFSKEYDNNFEYRFMEALRNYVQHRGLAVHSLSIDSRWTSLDKNGKLEYIIQIFSDKDKLDRDKSFKKKVLEEMPNKVELMSASRVYIESISNIHSLIREKLNIIGQNDRKLIEETIKQYKKINNEQSSIGLSAVCLVMNDDEYYDILDKVYLNLDWDDIRIKLSKKNKILSNLKKRTISNSIMQ